jgi:hypothetical protein
MTKLLEKACAKARELPEDEQDSVAIMLLSMTSGVSQIEPIDDETRAAILEGLEQARRGSLFPTRKSRRSGNAAVYEGPLYRACAGRFERHPGLP